VSWLLKVMAFAWSNLAAKFSRQVFKRRV